MFIIKRFVFLLTFVFCFLFSGKLAFAGNGILVDYDGFNKINVGLPYRVIGWDKGVYVGSSNLVGQKVKAVINIQKYSSNLSVKVFKNNAVPEIVDTGEGLEWNYYNQTLVTNINSGGVFEVVIDNFPGYLEVFSYDSFNDFSVDVSLSLYDDIPPSDVTGLYVDGFVAHWNFSNSDDVSKYLVYLDGVLKGEVDKSYNYFNLGELLPGQYSVMVKAVDFAGNVSNGVVYNFNVPLPDPVIYSYDVGLDFIRLNLSSNYPFRLYKEGVQIGDYLPGSYVVNLEGLEPGREYNFSLVSYYYHITNPINFNVRTNSVYNNLTVNGSVYGGFVRLNWVPVEGALSYSIYRNGVKIGETQWEYFNDFVPISGDYVYYVVANLGNDIFVRSNDFNLNVPDVPVTDTGDKIVLAVLGLGAGLGCIFGLRGVL